MKNFVLCFIVLFLLSSSVFAQNFALSEVSTNVGKGAFISGFDITVKLKSPGNLIDVTGNHQRVRASYLWNLPLSFQAGACGGFFKNMPFLGSYITWSPVNFLTLLEWCLSWMIAFLLHLECLLVIELIPIAAAFS